MEERRSSVVVSDGGGVQVTALETGAVQSEWRFIYAPGAGSGFGDPFGAFMAERLDGAGMGMVRFQFPYTEAGRRSPDRPAVLEATWRAMIAACGADGARLVVGGRSMGGRIASMVAARGAPIDALALFAYPLHPPGRPEQRRDGHLSAITAPTLFCSGKRDAFGSVEELGAAAALVERSRLHLMEAADHGFAATKASGRARQDVLGEATTVFLEWLQGI